MGAPRRPRTLGRHGGSRQPRPPEFFTAAFAAEHPEVVGRVRETMLRMDVGGYAACCLALRDTDLRGEAERVRAPALVVAGAHDRLMPPHDGGSCTRGSPRAGFCCWMRAPRVRRAVGRVQRRRAAVPAGRRLAAGEAGLAPLDEAAEALGRVLACRDRRQHRAQVLGGHVGSGANRQARVTQRVLHGQRRPTRYPLGDRRRSGGVLAGRDDLLQLARRAAPPPRRTPGW
jgi:hypothetical protein